MLISIMSMLSLAIVLRAALLVESRGYAEAALQAIFGVLCLATCFFVQFAEAV